MMQIKRNELVRKLAAVTLVSLLFADLPAASVSTNLAGMAVRSWLLAGNRLGIGARNDVGAVKAFSTPNGAAFNVVSLRDGGFVVTSNDTEIEPIIAFSETADFVDSPKNPLWVMLDKDLAARAGMRKSVSYANSASARTTLLSAPAAKWGKLTQGSSLGGNLMQSVAYASSSDSAVSDVRVEPLLETEWSQGGPCFNYYTPNHYPCGCVATATAQIMRYFRYPTGYVTPRTNTCEIQSGTEDAGGGYVRVLYSDYPLSMMGGYYDWANMPATVTGGLSTVQCEAIGKLTSDVGIACFMSYTEYGSGTGGYMAAPALKNVFGYANALPIVASGATFSADVLRAVLIPNLDARLPVLTSVEGPEGGHVVVADGYGYSSGTFYVHFRMGWDQGIGDSWYAPPNVEDFTAIDGFVYNIYPTGQSGGVICSGRVLSLTSGLPVAGVKVSVANPESHARGECTTDENGIYALILSAGTHQLIAETSVGSAVRSVTLDACVGTALVGTSYMVNVLGSVGNVYGFDLNLEPSLVPTNAVGVTHAGKLNTSFSVAQTIPGALYDKDNRPVGTMQVKVGKVGKNGDAKLSATATLLADGKTKKITAKAGSVTIDTQGRIRPRVLTFKSPIGAMTFEMAADGTFTLKNASYVMVAVPVGGALKDSARGTFGLERFDFAVPGRLQEDLLPNMEPFDVVGGKWKFAKAATVKWAKPKTDGPLPIVYDEASGKGLIVDETKRKTNRSGLKLTYTAKTGIFKGSFKAYALEELSGKTTLLKYTVNVLGLVVDGKGQGEATCKKPTGGPWVVTVE